MTNPGALVDWRALLSDSSCAEAIEVARGVGREMWAGDLAAEQPARLVEIALLCGYLGLVEHADDWRARAVELVELAIDRTSRGPARRLDMFGGLVGFGWAVEHLA